jgi:ribonuclease I
MIFFQQLFESHNQNCNMSYLKFNTKKNMNEKITVCMKKIVLLALFK